MDKKQLRKNIIDKLSSMPIDQKHSINHAFKKYLFASSIWNEAKTIGITISQGIEWNTKPIIEAAWEQGKRICVPKCYPKEKMLVFYSFQSYDQLERVYYNLLEPKPIKENQVDKGEIELLIVPGILFDKEGYRIGFGGGYYDRFLTDFPNTTVSLTSKLQFSDRIPSESHDIPVDHIITEDGFVR